MLGNVRSVKSVGHPNVLLIIVDDLRPTLGCYGDTLALTPNIDALAQEGVIFTRAYAQQALCGPSRTSFLTSRRPDTTLLYDVHSYWRKHAGNFTSLPQYFKEHGYHTASAGKIFHPGIVSNHSDDQPYSWSEEPFHPPTQTHKQDPVCLGPDGSLHTSIYCPVQVEEQPGGSLPDIETTQFAVSWLQQRAEQLKEASEPFFLAVGYHKPHIPLKFPSQFLDLYPISSVPLAPNRHKPQGLPSVAWNPWNDLRWRADIAALNVSFPYGPLPDFYARYIRQGYYAATTYTDSLIGDLLDAVNTHFPDTIIAFIGDHGWSLGEHQEWSKFSNFEVATRVPFIISHWRHHKSSPFLGFSSLIPERKKSGLLENDKRKDDYRFDYYKSLGLKFNSGGNTEFPRSLDLTMTSHDGLVELVDLFPTLVDLAGLPALFSCPRESRQVDICTEGMSLSPLLHLIQGGSIPKAFLTQGKAKGKDWLPDGLLSQYPLPANHTSTILKTVQLDSHLLHGVRMKKAVFSQYPRPGITPSVNPDSDQCHAWDATVMGYSMRTLRYRYTVWFSFNGTTLMSDWSHILAQELYDHKVDPQENHNVVDKARYAHRLSYLHTQLRNGWQQAVSTL
ncbi:hypothetical protein Pmani_039085 [Petrolisthes manimaculis]|uniref:Sulfatase N-terminal domain-containing protein n=1 Tax=Petrolisthes manimaculis TaxID=1843537 RepID=A0AAE1ND48_9EUCA|nr:hypothetical protein Pmani_039085 [Petrolisthes manimaculis]